MRDDHIQTLGLESAEFPKATFVLSSPVTLPADADLGVEIMSRYRCAHHPRHHQDRDDPGHRPSVGRGHRDRRVDLLPVGGLRHAGAERSGFVTVDGTATMEFDLFLKHG